MPEKKQSSTILNLLIIIFGLFFAFLGVIGLLTSFGIDLPDFLDTAFAAINDPAILSVIGAAFWTTAGIGIWAIIAGIFLFMEEEWAMGQSLVILSLMAVNSIPMVVVEFSASTINWGSMYLWIYLVVGVVSVVGFVYLLITSRRYH